MHFYDQIVCLFYAALLATACTHSRNIEPIRLPPTEDTRDSTPLPGEPFTIELDTGETNIVRLVETVEEVATGTIEIFGAPSATLFIDGGEPLAIPRTEELPIGPHDIRVTCADATSETYRITVEQNTMVTLRVCSQPRP